MANFHNTHIDTSEVPQLAELFERGMRMQKQYMSALGQRNVKSGHLASVSARARTHKHQVKAGEQGGKASQMTHKQNRTGCYSFAHQSETAIVGNHKQYHTDRGLISDKCELCQA